MQKIFIGFLFGVACMGAVWFFYGRPGIIGVRSDIDEVHRVYEQVQRTVDKVSIDASGLTGDIAGINTEAKTAYDRSLGISEGLTGNTGQIEFISGKVDELEQLNINLIRLGRNFGDLAFDLRRFSEKDGSD